MQHGTGTRRRLVVAALVILAAPLFADSIKLKTGRVLEGTIAGETEEAVEITVGGMTLKVPRDKIASVQKAPRPVGTTETLALERMDKLEMEGQWADLYEAADALLRANPKHKVAREKQELAASKLREALGAKRIEQFVHDRRFDDAIEFLTDQFRKSGLKGRGAGAVGRRALAELHLAKAEARMRVSLEGHLPLSEARKARQLDPTTPRLDLIEGMAQMKLHHFKQAIPLLERAARADPQNFGICIQLMKCCDATGDFATVRRICDASPDLAEATAERWPEVRDLFARAYMRAAIDASNAGKKAEAAAAYEKYLTFCERTDDELRRAAEFFERMGDAERAREIRDERLQRAAEELSPEPRLP